MDSSRSAIPKARGDNVCPFNFTARRQRRCGIEQSSAIYTIFARANTAEPVWPVWRRGA